MKRKMDRGDKYALWMVLLGVALIVFVIAHQALAQSAYPERDRWGFRYPPECRQDLSHVQVPIIYKSLAHLPGRHIGWYQWPKHPGDPGVVYVEKSVVDVHIRREIIHHELCHAWMWQLYGKSRVDWHP